MSGDCPWNLANILSQLEEAYDREGIQEYWPQESEAVESGLRAICTSLESKRYSPAGVLGVGGSGVVLRLSDQKFPTIDNALKFPRPVPGKVELVANMLAKEIHYLAQLRHRNIVRILYHDVSYPEVAYESLPYYLMEAVDGTSSSQFLKSNPSRSALIALLTDGAEVLRYLHSFDNDGFAHLDLKPSNFVVDSAGRAVMIDLGTCKRLSATDKDATTVACTRSFAHPELIRQLTNDPTDENRAKGSLARASINPRWDLWSFGLTLLAWIGLDHKTGKTEHHLLLRALDAYTRKYLFLLAGRLLSGSNLPPWISDRIGLSSRFLSRVPVQTAEDLLDCVERLSGTSNPLSRIQEMASAQTNTLQAAPGDHVRITSRLARVLDHRLFRRLNSISQLGLVCQVYPGAKHSRREHSLGTYANVLRMACTLFDDAASPLFTQLVDAEDLRALLLAALLHDVGHFPLAHDLEEIDSDLFDHAELTEAMLKGVWEKKKKGSRKLKFASFDRIFEAWEVEPERVLQILAARPTSLDASPKDKLLRSLLSGPIDADKLDYLLRDSRHLDLPYPRGVDVHRLFSCLTTVVVPRLEGGAQDVPVLGVQAKGKVTAEFLTMARYAMFSQAYWHHAVRAQKAMLLRAVHALLATDPGKVRLRGLQADFVDMVVNLPESLYPLDAESRTLFDEADSTPRLSRVAGLGTDLAATDAAVLAWLQERLRAADLPEAVLLEGILRRNLFKRLWVVSWEMESSTWKNIVDSWARLDRGQRHEVSHTFEQVMARRLAESGVQEVTALKGSTARDRIDRSTKGKIPWLLIDIPGARPGSDVPLYYVLESQRRALRKDDRSVGDLEKSQIWALYAKDLVRVAGKIRIFCHADLVDSVEASVKWPEGIEDLLTAIEQTAS